MAKQHKAIVTTFLETEGQLTYQWEIRIKDILALKPHEHIDSEKFYLCKEYWTLQIYKNSHSDLLVCIVRENALLFQNILYSFSLKFADKVLDCKSSDFSLVSSRKFQVISPLSINKLLNLENNMLKDLSSSPMVIVCSFRSFDRTCGTDQATQASEATQTSQATQTLTNELAGLSKSPENVFLKRELSDVKVKVGEMEFQAGKIVLAARLPVFASMFNHEMVENIKGIIHIEDCDPDNLEIFLKFIYSRRSRVDLVSSSNALNIYKIAQKYDLKELQAECCDCMSNNLTFDNICEALYLSETHNEKELLDKATDFFVKKFNDVLNTEKWLELLTEKPALANEFLKKVAAHYCLNNVKIDKDSKNELQNLKN